MEATPNTSHQNNDHPEKNIASEEKIVAASELKVDLPAENNNVTSSHNSSQPNVDSKTEINADSEITASKLPDISCEEQLTKSVEDENDAVTTSTTSTETTESTNEACRLETPSELQDVNNASTEVLLDVSITDRLAGLSIGGGDTSSSASGNQLDDEAKEKPSTSVEKPTPGTPKDKAELSRSILAGEISDNSECSIEIDEEEASNYDKVDCSGNGVSDEEMFIEDQDEDVEEEEEFHEVEEEKHKTSQELMGAAGRPGLSPRTAFKAPKSVSSNSSTKTDTPEATTASENVGGTLSKLEPSQRTATTNSVFNEADVSTSSQGAGEVGAVKLNSQLAQDKQTDSKTKQGETQVSANELPVNDSVDTREGAKSTDWANLMLSNIQGSTDSGVAEKASQEEGLETASKGADGKEAQKEDENVEKKELDLDEDVKNPQYIPKKGVFYEHDDRSHDVNNKKQPSTSVKNDEDTTEAKDSPASNNSNKKSSSQEKQVDNRRGNRRQRTETDRWGHDLFKDEKQKPKSKSELINAYGYDIRQERSSRNQPSDNRQLRGNNSNNSVDRPQGGQDQRSRQGRDNRRPRENQQPSNRSRDRRSRRLNNSNRNRSENSNLLNKPQNNARTSKPDPKESMDNRQSFQNSAPQQQTHQSSSSTGVSTRRDNQDSASPRDRNARFDNRGRRQNSKDRPLSKSAEDKILPPITTVMPPITTWSNKIEDMVKEEASRKESPSRHQQQHNMLNMNNSIAKNRSNDQWPQNTPNKSVYSERPQRIMDENRQQQFQQQQYTSRRYQDRDESHKSTQFINRNQYNDGRSNQDNSDWRRANNYNNAYAKPNEYEPIKTQTFENSRLAQNSMNRSHFRDHRDAREIINERRMQNHQNNFQQKVQSGALEQQRHQQHQHLHQQQQQHHHHQHQHQQQHQSQSQVIHHQQILQHQQMFQQQQANPQQHLRSQQPTVSLQQQQQSSQNQQTSHQQPSQQSTSQQLPGQRQPQQQVGGSGLQSTQSNQTQRQTIGSATGAITSTVNNAADGSQESGRLSSNTSTSNDLINSRPIVKTDAYNSANVAQHQQQHSNQSIQQHSQPNHRSTGAGGAGGGGHVSQQTSGSHLLASQMSSAAGNQPPYYSPASGSRDPAAVAAALASAYHGYMPSGHSVMDTSRYHMASQQLSDHGYMASPGQTNDVATASVLHQQGMYADTTPAGGTVANSAYMAQANSNLSPSTNIPVTGAGPPPMPPVSYLQHSQYAPPPYSNPYTQPPQPPHNQAPPPPQSTHAYPYWTYI